MTFSFGSEVKRVAGAQASQDAADENPLKDVLFCTKQAPWNAVVVDHNQVIPYSRKFCAVGWLLYINESNSVIRKLMTEG